MTADQHDNSAKKDQWPSAASQITLPSNNALLTISESRHRFVF